MIEYIEGDIFDSPAQVIVNTVNTVGVMGKGIALSFKQRYPEMFEKYKTACEKHQLTIGKLMLFYEPDHWLLLFPTKENWRNPSKLEYLEKGLMKFVSTYAEKNIFSIAFPKLGCGNGELDWNTVRPLMEKYLKPLPIDVYIYLGINPENEPEHKQPKKTIEWLKANAKDMSFNGVKDDLTITCSFMPYQFQIQRQAISAIYKDGICFCNSANQEICFVKEDELYLLWDDIRNKSLIKAPIELNKESLTYALLFSLGYLSKIRILNSKTNIMEDGYQINEGSGRVYSLKEDS
jgi:O-acetyl-ADP-ribose deacetylase (regulator of RNase III)